MTAENVAEYREARRAVEKRHARQRWFRHLVVYLVVNAMTIPINLTVADAYTWFYFPLVFWGLGVLIQLVGSVLRFDIAYDRQERQIQSMMGDLEQT